MQQEQNEVDEAKQIQVERRHEKQHDCVQVFVESQPNAFVSVLAADLNQIFAAASLSIRSAAE